MVQIGVAHRWVFTHDVHAAYLVWVTVISQDFVHDFNHGVASLIIQFGLPKIFKPGVRFGVGHALVIREHHGNQTRITGALHIVLPTQRVQARTWFANLTRDAAQRNQCPHIVCAMDVLAHAHAPQNHGAFSIGKRTRHFAQCWRRNTANLCH